ncbi:conserved hypothetical protein [Uncinocarpus reesii 1704]|uniref:RNA-binding protein PIN4 n=1 Tax=Uncinocarpus reesii (strain UAMH 1704) TaxID=336963 RepID=C4JME8_UNCRE|nr:uncharacterized protein UREG_04006 [Uncinocarpus reesii 1704]EEP79160.1 conserved hypothetical protein [Uncinocarpus reesii 1704]
MSNYHPPNQDMYHNSVSRSPGSHRHTQHQTQQLHRQPSRQFDAYGSMPASMFDDSLSRYDSATLDRMPQTVQSSHFPYDVTSAQSWNPNGLSGAHTLGSIGSNPLSASLRGRANVRGRSGIPTTWLDQSLQNVFPLAPGPLPPNPLRPENINHNHGHNHNHNHDGDDELIPTAIVIKNIPFAVKKEQLIQLMTEMSLPLPYAFNYHFDNGVFRGLAFANFTSAEETATVIDVLNHFDLNGRKLRVEYKKMLPAQERERIEREKRERRGQLEEQHRPMATSQLQNQNSMSSLASHLPAASPSPVSQRQNALDMNDAQTLQFYSQLLLFKQDATRESLIFASSLTPLQRRTVHTLAHNMGLGHASRGTGEQRQVHVYRASSTDVSPPIPAMPTTIHSADSARRGLNRAATIDFSEARGDAPNPFGTLRGHNSGYLGVVDSSPNAFGNAQNLRAAKSFADLRSYTPSPAPSSASYPAILHANGTRLHAYDGVASGNSNTPTLTPAPGSSIGLQRPDDNLLVNSLGGLTLGTTVASGNASSPRRLRSMFSWEQQETTQPSVTAPIGSNRSMGLSPFDSQGQERLPLRQPRGPIPERGSGFRRPGHQSRSSDELQQGRPEIVVE